MAEREANKFWTGLAGTSMICRILRVVLAALGRMWRGSAIVRAFERAGENSSVIARGEGFFQSDCVGLKSSRFYGFFAWLSRKLAEKKKLHFALRNSVPGKIGQAILSCGKSSKLLSCVFERGVTGILLALVGLYVLIDYVLRSVLAVPVLSSGWDELLLLMTGFWVVDQRNARKQPLHPALTPMDLPLIVYVAVCFVLLCINAAYPAIQMTGFRATCQYLAWFFLVTRLLRDEKDFDLLYKVMIALATCIALHGIYQYIVGVSIPSSWMTKTETSVRTRVYSIFGSPNIMGDYMVMFAPAAAGLIYSSKDRKVKALAFFATAVMCVACLFTMSRAAWAALALAVVIFAVLVDARLFGLMLIGGVCMLFLPFVRSRIGFLFTTNFAKATENGGRVGRRRIALYLFNRGSQWLGLGHGMFGGAVAMQNQVLDSQYFYVDNYYLKTLVETGYLGLGSFILALCSMIVTSLRSLARLRGEKKKRDRLYPICAGMFAGLCGIILHCGFENIFEEPYMMVYFWTLAAMIAWAGFLRPEKE